MKKFSLPLLVLMCAMVGISCKKRSPVKPVVNPLGPNYPSALNAIVTPAIIASVESHGTIIYDGLTPPLINGIYLLSPDSCIFDDSGYNYAGTLFDDYKFQFSSQDNTASTVTFAFKDIKVGTDAGSNSTATYISGTASSFTVFSENSAVSNGVSNVQLSIISGVLQNGYIQNLQWASYLVSKGNDPNNVLEPVGSIRIFVDEDGESGTQQSFSLPPTTIQSIGMVHGKTMLSVGQSH
jgi:hypothetical protein